MQTSASALQIKNNQASVKGLATSWCQAVWGDEIHIAPLVQDRQQLGNHENVQDGLILQAGQQSSCCFEACYAQLHTRHMGGDQQLVTESGREGGGGSASGEKPGPLVPDQPTPTSHQGGPPTCSARGVL